MLIGRKDLTKCNQGCKMWISTGKEQYGIIGGHIGMDILVKSPRYWSIVNELCGIDHLLLCWSISCDSDIRQIKQLLMSHLPYQFAYYHHHHYWILIHLLGASFVRSSFPLDPICNHIFSKSMQSIMSFLTCSFESFQWSIPFSLFLASFLHFTRRSLW